MTGSTVVKVALSALVLAIVFYAGFRTGGPESDELSRGPSPTAAPSPAESSSPERGRRLDPTTEPQPTILRSADKDGRSTPGQEASSLQSSSTGNADETIAEAAPTASDPSLPSGEGGSSTPTGQSGPREIPVADELKSMFDNDDSPTKGLHDQLQREERDQNWSAAMEAQIREYLSSKPELVTFMISGVECRTTGCEIQVIGYGNSVEAVWVSSISDIYAQPWFEFTGMSSSIQSLEPATDVVGVVVILTRDASAS